jgi:hypothetical protein
MIFIVNNQKYFETNVQSVRTRNKNQLQRPVVKLFICAVKVFNTLPSSFTSGINKKVKFKVTLKRYLITHLFYSVGEL